MKLIFVRHGESLENKKEIVGGHKPGSLTRIGVKQAKDMARKLKNVKIDYIYSSDLKRAHDTAKEIAKFHPNAPFVTTTAIRERSMGSWQGKKRSKVGWTWEGLWVPRKRLGGGETIAEVYNRMRRFAKMVIKEHRNDTILIVGHGYSGMLLMAAFEDKKADYWKNSARLKNTGIMRLVVK